MSRNRKDAAYPGVWVFRRKKSGALLATWDDPVTRRRRQASLTALGYRSRLEADTYCKNLSDKLKRDRLGLELVEAQKRKQRDDAESAGEEPEPNDAKPWPEIIASYLEQYAAERGNHAAKRVDYELNTFRAWLAGPGERCKLGKDLSKLLLVSIHDFLKALKKQRSAKGKRGAYVPTDESATEATKNSRRATIVALLNWARRREYVRFSSDDIRDKIPKARQGKKVPAALKVEALTALIRAAVACDSLKCFSGRHDKQAYDRGEASEQADHRYKPLTPLLILLALTGMRLGEALHVRWDNVDFEQLEIKVCADPNTGWQPKTRDERDVPFADSPLLASLLSGLRLKRGASQYVIGGDKPDKPREFSRPAWNRMVDVAGLSSASPKILRSTFATSLGSAHGGPTPYQLARRMGHSIEIAAKHYVGKTNTRLGKSVEDWLGIASVVAEALTKLGIGVPLRAVQATSEVISASTAS